MLGAERPSWIARFGDDAKQPTQAAVEFRAAPVANFDIAAAAIHRISFEQSGALKKHFDRDLSLPLAVKLPGQFKDDRQSVVKGTRVAVRVDIGWRGTIQK